MEINEKFQIEWQEQFEQFCKFELWHTKICVVLANELHRTKPAVPVITMFSLLLLLLIVVGSECAVCASFICTTYRSVGCTCMRVCMYTLA